MADRPRPETGGDAGRGRDRGAGARRPRGVFVLGVIIVIALFALIVFLHLSGSIGPGVH